MKSTARKAFPSLTFIDLVRLMVMKLSKDVRLMHTPAIIMSVGSEAIENNKLFCAVNAPVQVLYHADLMAIPLILTSSLL